ncbi:hypothetical protein ARMGADRAFT_1102098 [Armillaria gallica]|uniref:Uncharacterized protein n=1 Tax=Armillaria gallica TaxID=47427 RepID=A0A2H3CLU2_ARMGA|nr:hypothetical protein ARMGADRAFT_1102098 [Armillaria gallica]
MPINMAAKKLTLDYPKRAIFRSRDHNASKDAKSNSRSFYVQVHIEAQTPNTSYESDVSSCSYAIRRFLVLCGRCAACCCPPMSPYPTTCKLRLNVGVAFRAKCPAQWGMDQGGDVENIPRTFKDCCINNEFCEARELKIRLRISFGAVTVKRWVNEQQYLCRRETLMSQKVRESTRRREYPFKIWPVKPTSEANVARSDGHLLGLISPGLGTKQHAFDSSVSIQTNTESIPGSKKGRTQANRQGFEGQSA